MLHQLPVGVQLVKNKVCEHTLRVDNIDTRCRIRSRVATSNVSENYFTFVHVKLRLWENRTKICQVRNLNVNNHVSRAKSGSTYIDLCGLITQKWSEITVLYDRKIELTNLTLLCWIFTIEYTNATI